MAWQDQLQQGSFRNVPFFTTEAVGEFGRRSIAHEFPLRDKPFVEDLGRRARQFTFEALVLGAEDMTRRDRLLSALERGGPGNLVHPYIGSMVVSVFEVKLKESTAEGGLARFTITVIESGAELFVSSGLDGEAVLRSVADLATEAARGAFEQTYKTEGLAEYVSTAANKIFGGALDSMQASVGLVRNQADQVAALARQVAVAKQLAITTIYTPASAAQALVASVKLLVREVAYGPCESLGLARVFFRFGSELPNVAETTAGRQQQARNQTAMLQLVRVGAISEGARAASQVDFTSYQEAVAARDDLAAAIDELQEAGVPDDLHDALARLRAATVRDITARGANLARITKYSPGATVPALVLAYQLYADASRDVEIVARNAVRHPGFLPGAQALEVLTDA